MRRSSLPLWLALVAVLPSGCGGKFELPTERPGRVVPTDQSYAVIATWQLTGPDTIKDLLLTQGQGNQLFALFNRDRVDSTGPSVPRGQVRLYPLSRPEPIGAPYFEAVRTLFNPIALASAAGKLYVLDRGDSCLAKLDVRRGTCKPDEEVAPADTTIDTTGIERHPYRSKILDYSATWRVREYGLGGGDTLSTFTDTSFAQPNGIAADELGRIYVAGIAVVLDTLQTDQRIRTRKFVSRVFRYSRGPKFPGVLDVNMPGTSSWHRDMSWVVFDGTGASSISDPRGIYLSPRGTNPLFIADRGNNQVKGVSSNEIGVSVVRTDGQATGANLNHPESVTADLAGFFYMVDRDNRRVLRYDLSGEYIQRVDEKPNEQGLPLLDPTSVAVDDSLAYVADRGRQQIIRYRRHP